MIVLETFEVLITEKKWSLKQRYENSGTFFIAHGHEKIYIQFFT